MKHEPTRLSARHVSFVASNGSRHPMKQTFFGRRALTILMIVAFLVPFALRGARQAVQGMKNDVRDWLPSTYDETGQLHWFRDHFLGEQFVLVSWEGCTGDEQDELFRNYMAKLLPSTPPSQLRERLLAENLIAPDQPLTPEIVARVESENPLLKRVLSEAEVPLESGVTIGDELGLYTTESYHTDWGKQQEKWLKGYGGDWYYILPNGDLYRWDGVDAPVASLGRTMRRALGDYSINGELVKSFGSLDGPWYYDNPRRLRAQLFKTITTGPGVYESLTNDENGVLRNDPDVAKDRLIGSLFGPDGKQTCLVLTLTDAARRDLHQVVGRAMLGKPLGRLYEIWGECGSRPKETLRLGGPPVDNVAIDEEGTITLVRLVGLSVGLGLTLSYLCFRSITATLMVFFVGGISAVISVAAVWWFGSSMDAIMMSMPSLVYVLGLSGAVHLINYYHEAIEESGTHVGAPEAAIKHGWSPALLCNITTAIGLISLYTSEIVPIRKFGIFSAFAVMAMLIVTFTYLPAALQLFPQKPRRKREDWGRDEEPWLDRYLGGFWAWLGGGIIRHSGLVAIGCTLFIIGTGYGVTRIQTSVNLLKMFDPSAKIIADYEWLEANLGRLVPMEVVVKVDKNMLSPPIAEGEMKPADDSLLAARDSAVNESVKLNFLSRMELAAKVQAAIEAEFGPTGQDKVGKAMSAVTFTPVLPAVKNDLSTFMERRATNRKLEENRDRFLASDYLRIDRENGDELWRISVRLAASKKVDYGAFVTDLKSVVEPVLAAYGDRETIVRSIALSRFAQRSADADLGPDDIAKAIAPFGANVLVIVPQAKDGAAVDPVRIRMKTLAELLTTARMKVTALPELPQSAALANYERIITLDGSPITGVPSERLMALSSGSPAEAQTTRLGAVYTGVVPIVYKAQRALLQSLIESTFWSFLTITPLMMFVARSFWAGAVAMLPNVLPVFVIFGLMGWMGVEVDVGSMMTASIALGVAVDDTIHYLTWFRQELDIVGDRKEAILRTYKRCATPTFQAALISGLGLSIFAVSTFTPTQRFGYLMLTILWAGVVAELIYFPALLAGPLGMVFKPRTTPEERAAAARARGESLAEAESDAPAVVKFPRVKPHKTRSEPPRGVVG